MEAHDQSAARPRTNGFAVASLALGIAGLATLGLLSVPALVLGYGGKREIDRSGGAQGGRGLAVAGIVLGWAGLAWALFWIVVLFGESDGGGGIG